MTHPTEPTTEPMGDGTSGLTNGTDATGGRGGAEPGSTLYDRLIADLDVAGASYRLLDHPAEGRTELVSAMRGHAVAHAAKCMVLMVKIGKKQTRYVLAVVPGDARVDLAAVKTLLGGSYVTIASSDKAEELAGSISGTVLPISYDPRLELVADPAVLQAPELYFNAARLDRSLAVRTADWAALAHPRLAEIGTPADTPSRAAGGTTDTTEPAEPTEPTQKEAGR